MINIRVKFYCMFGVYFNVVILMLEDSVEQLGLIVRILFRIIFGQENHLSRTARTQSWRDYWPHAHLGT